MRSTSNNVSGWGIAIKNFRRDKEMSQDDLADKLGVSRNTIRRWENEENVPNAFQAFKLSYVLEVKIEEIFF